MDLKKNYFWYKINGLFSIFNIFLAKIFLDADNYLQYFENKYGLEIGGPSYFFKDHGGIPIYSVVSKLDNCNFSKNTVWNKEIKEGQTYYFHEKKDKGFQYICEAGDLKEIPADKYDFILASHVFEHIANPIKAIKEWDRVLKKNGVILLIIPHNKHTFDHKRPITSINHLIEDYMNEVKEGDLTHINEILNLHDLTLDPEAGDFNSFKKRSFENFHNRCLHHHVFDENNIYQLIHYMGLKIVKFDMISLIMPQHIIILVHS